MPPLQLSEPATELMGFLQQLPTESLIVAWPGQKETSLIPYVAGRPLFVYYKAHYPTYEQHILSMRERMFDLIDAYLAQDQQPLIDLYCRWQADYLVIDRTLLSGSYALLSYFEPFDERTKMMLEGVEKSQLFLRQPPADAVVFTAANYTVLSLKLLAKNSNCLDGE